MTGLNRRALLVRGAGALTGAALGAEAGPPPAQEPRERAVLRDDFGEIAGWERQGVIMSRSLPWESTLLQDPCLVYGEGGGPLFKMWYGSLHAVGYATSEDGRRWTKAAEPVLTPTLPSESNALNQPSVVHKDGVWHMTYFGVAGDGNGQIHYATAKDPAGPWEKHGVVLTSTMPWEDRWIYNSSLLYDRTARLWKMWYTAGKIASAGGEPEYICYATARTPAGPWTKHPGNPVIRPMDDGGWASLGVGGPNVRKLRDGGYETRIVGWQADYPSRGGRLTSRDGVTWRLDRDAMQLDLGPAGGPEDGMIYRQFVVEHEGRQYLYYNTKNNRPGWNETINLAVWNERLRAVDPAKWCMTQAWFVPGGASFEAGDGYAMSRGDAPEGHPQTLQGNVRIDALDYAISASITPISERVADRDNVLLARATGRDGYYYAGIASWGQKYAIGVMVKGANTKLAGVGSASDIKAGEPHRLRFALDGSRLDLYDDDRLVLSVVDPTLIPAASFVGLQTSTGTGRARFAAVSVTARATWARNFHKYQNCAHEYWFSAPWPHKSVTAGLCGTSAGFITSLRCPRSTYGEGDLVLGIDTCLAEVMSIPGALDAMLLDHTSGMAVAFSSASGVDADRSAAALTEALRATTDGLTRVCPGEVVRIDDMLVTTDKGHHLLRPLETVFEGPLVIYVRLDLERSNLALARHRLRSVSSQLTT